MKGAITERKLFPCCGEHPEIIKDKSGCWNIYCMRCGRLVYDRKFGEAEKKWLKEVEA